MSAETCVLTVVSLRPSRVAICLLDSASTMRTRTSDSRGDRVTPGGRASEASGEGAAAAGVAGADHPPIMAEEAGDRTVLPAATLRIVSAMFVTRSSLAMKPRTPAARARLSTPSATKVVRMRTLISGRSVRSVSAREMPSMRGICTSSRRT